MATKITTDWLAANVDPGVRIRFSELLAKPDPEYVQLEQVFHEIPAKTKTEEINDTTGFTYAESKAEGAPTPEQEIYQGRALSVTQSTYGTAFRVSAEMVEDDLSGAIADCPDALFQTMALTAESLRALVMDNAYTAGVTGYDGLTLANDSHLRPAGLSGTWDNNIAATELTYAGLQTAINLLQNQTTDRGIPLPFVPAYLVVPTALQFTADKVLFNAWQADTTMRNENRTTKMFPGIKLVISPFLTNSSQWFLFGKPREKYQGIFIMWKRKPKKPTSETLQSDQGFRTLTTMRLATAWYKHKNVICSQGI